MSQSHGFVRPAVGASLGMVVCPHFLASQVGLAILRLGGHAVDAAIAMNAALGVVYPHMTGLGGDGFWLIYQAQARRCYGLNGSGRAGRGVTRQRLAEADLAVMPVRGPQAVITVPGSVDAWWQAHQRFGRLPWERLLDPAIALAEEGYPASVTQVHWTRRNQQNLINYANGAVPFLPGGCVPQMGERLTNPCLGATLRQLAEMGGESFYRGALAEQMVAHLVSWGGWLTEDDFAQHQSTWIEPISTSYRGYRVCQLPPNTQGFTVLQMLNLIEPFDLNAIGHGTVDYYHLLLEATKVSFADRDHWLSDPDFVNIPVAELISKAYAARRRDRLSMVTAQAFEPGSMGGDTVYSAVVDCEGNAVSVLQSLYFDFGSAVVPAHLGFALHNRGALFSLDPAHHNRLEPGKRPFHTLIPGLVLDPERNLCMVLGTMGGEGQPQTQLALLTRVLDFGFDPQRAIDLPRWVWGRTWGESSTSVVMEGRIPLRVREGLRRRGHEVRVAPNWTEQMGHAHMICVDPMGGGLVGGSDPRSDGVALGLDIRP